ncbi:TPA: hypothetical protein ACH3X1_006523 [Trebouxia sp. C0004]
MQPACRCAGQAVTAAQKALRPLRLLPSGLTAVRGLHISSPSCLRIVPSSHAVLRQRTCRALATSSSAVHMDSDVAQLIKLIHDNPAQAVFYATGGGMQVAKQWISWTFCEATACFDNYNASQALTWLLTVPGASKTVLESRVPYAQSALHNILGQSTVNYASVDTANSMAKAAYQQAAKLSPFGASIVGVGCTCALMTDRIKKGDHKAFIATHTGSVTRSYSLQLTKGKRHRLGEDAVASKLLLNALATACKLPRDALIDNGLLAGSEHIQEETSEIADPISVLLKGDVQSVEYSSGNVVVDAPRGGRVYMAGSFNPLHEGHRGMLAAALTARQDTQGQMEGCYEMSVGNADKGLMPAEEVKRRVQPFIDENLPLVLTQAPLYPDKAKIFHNSTFVLGYDTAVRLVMPKYYGGHDGMLLHLAGMSHLGCHVVVAGRVATDDQGESSFMTFEDVEVPDAITDLGLFSSIPEALFRSDISSTQLRKKLAEQQK